jgi:hypothetical protein
MTTSRILACYQTRKTPDFAPTQQFAMHRFGAEFAKFASIIINVINVLRVGHVN